VVQSIQERVFIFTKVCMLIVAIAWIYVVGLMALTEPSIVAGIMTFLLYCVAPLAILFYLTGAPRRKRNRLATEPPADNTPPGPKE
jgi:FtsH-binding integral membrane protein